MEAYKAQSDDFADYYGSIITYFLVKQEGLVITKMRDNVEIYTTSLIHAIRDSKEYREFNSAKKALADKPNLKEQIVEFRKENFVLQNTNNSENLFQKVEEFRKKKDEFLKNPLVAEYLRCELAMCRMLQKISLSVVESIDLELEEVAKDINR